MFLSNLQLYNSYNTIILGIEGNDMPLMDVADRRYDSSNWIQHFRQFLPQMSILHQFFIPIYSKKYLR